MYILSINSQKISIFLRTGNFYLSLTKIKYKLNIQNGGAHTLNYKKKEKEKKKKKKKKKKKLNNNISLVSKPSLVKFVPKCLFSSAAYFKAYITFNGPFLLNCTKVRRPIHWMTASFSICVWCLTYAKCGSGHRGPICGKRKVALKVSSYFIIVLFKFLFLFALRSFIWHLEKSSSA